MLSFFMMLEPDSGSNLEPSSSFGRVEMEEEDGSKDKEDEDDDEVSDDDDDGEENT
jgi:hypothetical protein